MTRYHICAALSTTYVTLTQDSLTYAQARSKHEEWTGVVKLNGGRPSRLCLVRAGTLFVPPMSKVDQLLREEGFHPMYCGDYFLVTIDEATTMRFACGDHHRLHWISDGCRTWSQVPTTRKNNWKKELRAFLSSVREMDSKETD